MTDAPKTIAEMREAAADRAERRGFATLAAEILAIPLPADDAEMVESVARALCCTEKKGANCRVVNCAAKNAIHMVMARAALSAMRGEP